MKTAEGVIILILLGIIYKILPSADIYNPFILRQDLITNWQFVAFAVILRLMIFYFSWELAKCKEGFERYFIKCFSLITLGKTIDFGLCGNSEYWGISYLTFNTVSMFAFLTHEFLREWRSSYAQDLY